MGGPQEANQRRRVGHSEGLTVSEQIKDICYSLAKIVSMNQSCFGCNGIAFRSENDPFLSLLNTEVLSSEMTQSFWFALKYSRKKKKQWWETSAPKILMALEVGYEFMRVCGTFILKDFHNKMFLIV